LELVNEASADPAFSEFVFPASGLVDYFEVCSRHSARQTTCFVLKGIYAWRLHWVALTFSRTPIPATVER
jgi:hypothetical protein